MSKFCVFCGKQPDSKTKEHVVPRWLIELTGNPNRNAFLGLIKNPKTGFKNREYAFDQFTFPACSTCNQKYSSLEATVKPIILKVLNEESVLAEEISKLLDWLDKVRVGLWLGMNQLDKNYTDVDPNFHIDTRVGQYDRLLIIEKTDANKNKLNMGGIDTLSFSYTPSAFVLIINNFYFTNISYMFLLSRRIGFPYPTKISFQSDSERFKAEFERGKERFMLPLLRKNMNDNGVKIYQPMFRCGLIDGDVDLYDSDYVKKHSMNFSDGVGNIFIETQIGLTEYKLGDELSLKPKNIQNDHKLFVNSAINICEWQNWLTELLPSVDTLTQDQKYYIKRRFKTAIRVNRLLINHHKRLI